MVILHADAVAQNGAAGVRAGRVDGDDAQSLPFTPIMLCELIDQRALPRSRWAREAKDAGPAAMREQRLQQVSRVRPAVFDGADGASQGACVAGT